MSRNLAARIAVAAVAIPIILWICYQGGWWLFGMVSLLALVGMLEFLHNEGCRPTELLFWLGLLTVTGVFLGIADTLTTDNQSMGHFMWAFAATALLSILFFFLVGSVLSAVAKDPPPVLMSRFSRLLWGVLYIGMLYPFVFFLGHRHFLRSSSSFSGGDTLLFLFGVLWIGDTAAMATGKWLGRRKLAPAVSPHKTVEGFAGGIVGALVVGVVMIFWKFAGVAWYHVLVLAVGASLFGQLGDLVESMWKRSLGIKDSSALIPGHGGVLDRFDSLLFAAPFMFYYVNSFIGQ